jgi:hypothetical protein
LTAVAKEGLVEIVLVIGLVFGLICAVLASPKNRSPVGWFFIGFLIPLIGLILILVLPPNPAALQNPSAMPPTA